MPCSCGEMGLLQCWTVWEGCLLGHCSSFHWQIQITENLYYWIFFFFYIYVYPARSDILGQSYSRLFERALSCNFSPALCVSETKWNPHCKWNVGPLKAAKNKTGWPICFTFFSASHRSLSSSCLWWACTQIVSRLSAFIFSITLCWSIPRLVSLSSESLRCCNSSERELCSFLFMKVWGCYWWSGYFICFGLFSSLASSGRRLTGKGDVSNWPNQWKITTTSRKQTNKQSVKLDFRVSSLHPLLLWRTGNLVTKFKLCFIWLTSVNMRNRRHTLCDKRENNYVWKKFPPNFTFLQTDLEKDQNTVMLSEDHDKTRKQ